MLLMFLLWCLLMLQMIVGVVVVADVFEKAVFEVFF